MTTTTLTEVSRRLPFLSPSVRSDLALAALRLAAGIPLFFHGSQKLFGWFGGEGIAGFAGYLAKLGVPFPTLSAALAATSEVGGALLLFAGVGFWALPPVLFTMLVAAVTSARNGYDVAHGGAEYPLVLALLVAASALLGPGGLALRLGRRAS